MVERVAEDRTSSRSYGLWKGDRVCHCRPYMQEVRAMHTLLALSFHCLLFWSFLLEKNKTTGRERARRPIEALSAFQGAELDGNKGESLGGSNGIHSTQLASGYFKPTKPQTEL